MSESFQLQSRNKPCEANVYFHPPSELESPQMHNNTQYWENHLRNPFACHHIIIHEHRKLMRKQVDTVPLMSNFICKSTADSICGNERNGEKWIAGVFVERKLFDRICNKVVIWKVESFSLETLCVYCDSCDSFKTISLQTKLIPTSGNELERVLKEIEEKSREPHSIRVVLQVYVLKYVGLKKQQRANRHLILKQSQKFPIDKPLMALTLLADVHLTSLLMPNLANATVHELSFLTHVDRL